MNNLKTIFSFLSIVTITLLFFPANSWSQTEGTMIDKVVAQVGDNIILQSDIEQQKTQLVGSGGKLNPNSSCELLEELMYQELLINQAKLDSIKISDQQVDAEMENRLRLIEKQIGSREKLEAFYGKTVAQIKDEFRLVIKDKLLAQEMEGSITNGIAVTPKEVQEFYKTIPVDSIPLINSQLSFQQIVHYPKITKEDKKLAYDKLAEIRNNIINGKSFETQARINSMDPGSAQQGGKIEASKGMMVPQFEATVFSLSKGQVSEIFETSYGYHIIKLIERKGDDYSCQHILIIPEFNPMELEKSAAIMDSCYKLLKSSKISWEDAVLTYSNDEATNQNKGIITNPISGEQTWDMEDLNQVDQQIFLLTDALSKGEISSPNLYYNLYDHKQGVRIVRLLERTQPHKANLNEDYALIKRATENDKKQKVIKNWVKSKLANAYIRIDDEYKKCDFKNQWLKK
ncbi:MAG: peptidylprolyl isomerase [Crocinitomicaceae bacterium]|nr:peptidylprolyl isomerase [Crocinitomicaceae bacterium]